MMPSARTPTTSNRWMTALSAEALRPADDAGEGDQHGAEESRPGRPGCVRPRRPIRQARSGRAASPGGSSGRTCAGASASATWLSRPCDLLAGADHLGAAIAHRAVDQPGADRVHLLDAAEVERQRVGQRVDLALGRGGAGNGDRPDAAIRLLSGPRFGWGSTEPAIRRGNCAKSRKAASPVAICHFVAAVDAL